MNGTQAPVDYALAPSGICRERLLEDVCANVVLAAEIGKSQRMMTQLEHLVKTAALGL